MQSIQELLRTARQTVEFDKSSVEKLVTVSIDHCQLTLILEQIFKALKHQANVTEGLHKEFDKHKTETQVILRNYTEEVDRRIHREVDGVARRSLRTAEDLDAVKQDLGALAGSTETKLQKLREDTDGGFKKTNNDIAEANKQQLNTIAALREEIQRATNDMLDCSAQLKYRNQVAEATYLKCKDASEGHDRDITCLYRLMQVDKEKAQEAVEEGKTQVYLDDKGPFRKLHTLQGQHETRIEKVETEQAKLHNKVNLKATKQLVDAEFDATRKAVNLLRDSITEQVIDEVSAQGVALKSLKEETRKRFDEIAVDTGDLVDLKQRNAKALDEVNKLSETFDEMSKEAETVNQLASVSAESIKELKRDQGLLADKVAKKADIAMFQDVTKRIHDMEKFVIEMQRTNLGGISSELTTPSKKTPKAYKAVPGYHETPGTSDHTDVRLSEKEMEELQFRLDRIEASLEELDAGKVGHEEFDSTLAGVMAMLSKPVVANVNVPVPTRDSLYADQQLRVLTQIQEKDSLTQDQNRALQLLQQLHKKIGFNKEDIRELKRLQDKHASGSSTSEDCLMQTILESIQKKETMSAEQEQLMKLLQQAKTQQGLDSTQLKKLKELQTEHDNHLAQIRQQQAVQAAQVQEQLEQLRQLQHQLYTLHHQQQEQEKQHQELASQVTGAISERSSTVSPTPQYAPQYRLDPKYISKSAEPATMLRFRCLSCNRLSGPFVERPERKPGNQSEFPPSQVYVKGPDTAGRAAESTRDAVSSPIPPNNRPKSASVVVTHGGSSGAGNTSARKKLVNYYEWLATRTGDRDGQIPRPPSSAGDGAPVVSSIGRDGKFYNYLSDRPSEIEQVISGMEAGDVDIHDLDDRALHQEEEDRALYQEGSRRSSSAGGSTRPRIQPRRPITRD